MRRARRAWPRRGRPVSVAAARLRMATARRRRRRIGVDVGAALNLVARFLTYFASTFLVPDRSLAAGYGEPVWPFLAARAITARPGRALERLTGGGTIGAREGFLVVALTWALGAWAVALPYLLGEPQLRNPIDAYFEAMSGMTTTGASTLTDIPALGRVDGDVAPVLAVARRHGHRRARARDPAAPRVGGGRQLMESRCPGRSTSRSRLDPGDRAPLLARLHRPDGADGADPRDLRLDGVDPLMSEYQAAAHAFTTLPTGGFSPQARSIEPFAPASQWVIVLFMVLAGANFALHYRALVRTGQPVSRRGVPPLSRAPRRRRPAPVPRAAAGRHLRAGRGGVRHATFQVVSMMTTTGYASADFALWTALTLDDPLALMLIGGSAGSTGGAIKVVRWLLIGKLVAARARPDACTGRRSCRSGSTGGPSRSGRFAPILAFGLLYLVLFFVGAFVLMVDAAVTDPACARSTPIGAAATTLGNVGPGFGFAGPMGSFDAVQPVREDGHDPAHVGRPSGDHPGRGAPDAEGTGVRRFFSFRGIRLSSSRLPSPRSSSSGRGSWPAGGDCGRRRCEPPDGAFTSTSAVCVTGLIVVDTPVYWSTFGAGRDHGCSSRSAASGS